VPASHLRAVEGQWTGASPALTLRRAQWLRTGLIGWDLPLDAANFPGASFRLHHADRGGLEVAAEGVTGGPSIPLTVDPAGLPADVRADWPHLAAYGALRLPAPTATDRELLSRILTGQVVIARYDDLDRLVDATGVQIPGVLDDLYGAARDRRLGLRWALTVPVFALWAPTAKNVTMLLDPPGGTGGTRVAMGRDRDGIWSTRGESGWRNGTYRYEVEVYVPSTGKVEWNVVTDPYSVALTTDSAASVIADLTSPALTPPGWSTLAKTDLAQRADSTIYELHIRDFSIADTTVPAAHRGTYLAFTDVDGAGMQHLKRLADAGLNTVHLMPAFDIAGIPDSRTAQAVPAGDLAAFAPDSDQQQARVGAVADTDGFNWGYDPLHYTTPEGSYSTNPDGAQRTREFRQMVAGLNGIGLRVVLDVVYNHTAAAGQQPNSVLDRVVPGYYHRLSATGEQETSTCCANTASEHAMMEKLMIDSIVTWALQYRVDGFRFDLMGHHSRQNILHVRAALDRLTPLRDGVDGAKIFLYGEGWNFGEVADNARFVQATQATLAGSGIATFSDRLRDAVRGGGPWSLFNRNDTLHMKRPNPGVERGNLSSALFGARGSWQHEHVAFDAGADVEVVLDAPSDEHFTQTTIFARAAFPTFVTKLGTQSFVFHTHMVLTAGDTAPPQRFAYLGGSGTLPTFELLSRGGDRLVFLEGLYNFPIQTLHVPFLGTPIITVREMLGGTGVGSLGRFDSNIGARLTLGFLSGEVFINPDNGDHVFSFGLSLIR